MVNRNFLELLYLYESEARTRLEAAQESHTAPYGGDETRNVQESARRDMELAEARNEKERCSLMLNLYWKAHGPQE